MIASRRARVAALLALAGALLPAPAARGQARHAVYMPALGPVAQAPPSPQLPGPTFRWVGEVGGAAMAVAVHGRAAYLGESRHLVVVDIADPAAPRRVGQLAPFAGYIHDLTIADGRLYVAAGSAGLRVLDLSDPLAPREVGALETGGDAREVVVEGAVAYLADGPGGLRLIDVADPASPRALGRLDTIQPANALDVEDGRAYVAIADARSAGLLVVDVADPAQPRELGALASTGQALGVTVAPPYAYLSDGVAGLATIDIADTSRPRLVALAGMEPSGGMVIHGGFGYVLGASEELPGLWVADLSEPSDPMWYRSIETERWNTDMVIADGRAILANAASGLETWELDEGDLGPALGRLDAPGLRPIDVAVAGGHLVARSEDFGENGQSMTVRVLDLEQPAAPREVGRLTVESGWYGRMAALEGFVFLPFDRDNLAALDLSDPTAPRAMATFGARAASVSLAAAGGLLFVGDGRLGRLTAYRPSRAGAPVEVGSISLPNSFDLLAASSDRVHAAFGPKGALQALDVADAARPRLLGGAPSPDLSSSGSIFGLAAAGRHAYLATRAGSLHVFDSGGPDGPTLVASLPVGLLLHAVAAAGGHAWVSSEGEGLWVVDVSDPARPRTVHRFDTRGEGWNLALRGDHAYLADGSGGLQVFRLADGLRARGAGPAGRGSRSGAPRPYHGGR